MLQPVFQQISLVCVSPLSNSVMQRPRKKCPLWVCWITAVKETFLSKASKADISDRKTDIIIKTLNGERNMESEEVTGLRVSKEIRGEKCNG